MCEEVMNETGLALIGFKRGTLAFKGIKFILLAFALHHLKSVSHA